VRTATVAIAAAAFLSAAACGDNGEGAGTTEAVGVTAGATTTVAGSPTETVTTAAEGATGEAATTEAEGATTGDAARGLSAAMRAIEPDAQARAEAVVLMLSDFPDGWRAGPADETDEDAEEDFRRCVGVDLSALTIIGEADSDSFAMGSSTEVGSSVAVFESEQMARDAFEARAAAFDSNMADRCLTELIGDPEDEDLEFGELEVSAVSSRAPEGVDDAGAWQLVLPVQGVSGTESEGVSANAYVDVVTLRVGDTVAELQAGDVLSPFDPLLFDELVAAVATRMAE
jgi:hypothetical protein